MPVASAGELWFTLLPSQDDTETPSDGASTEEAA